MQIIKTTIGNLKSALQQVLKAVETKRVTLQFKAGNMFVHACEADAHARALVATTGEVPDSVVPLPGKNLLAIINAYNVDAECTIAHVDRGLRFNFGGAKVTLDRFGEADIELFEEKVSSFGYLGITKLKASQLTFALTTVERFAAREDMRMYLRGVYLQSIDGKLVLTATDGFRLAENVTDMDVTDMQPMILPVCFAEALRAVLKGEDEVEFAILGEDEVRRLRFSTTTFRLDCPLIGGAYPNYKAVIPETTATVTMNTRALAAAIDRMAIVSGTYVRLNFQPGTLTVTAVDDESSETIATEGDEVQLKVGFQAKLLSDSLVAITGEKVSISVNPEKEVGSKLLFKNAGVDDGWKAVVMPANV